MKKRNYVMAGILAIILGISPVSCANYMYEQSTNETVVGVAYIGWSYSDGNYSSYVTCPAGCTCMGEKNALNQGRVPCGVNGSCGVNQLGQNMYCYSDIIPTPAATPVTRIPTTAVTAVPTTAVSSFVAPAATEPTQPVVLSGCGPDCRCMLPDAADSLSLPLCGGTPVLCSYDASGRGMYCYALAPQTAPPYSPMQPASGSVPALTECPAGCTCLDPATSRQLGLDLCGESPLLCNYDTNGNPFYCYNRAGASMEGQDRDTSSATGIPLGPFTTILAGTSATLLYALYWRKKD